MKADRIAGNIMLAALAVVGMHSVEASRRDTKQAEAKPAWPAAKPEDVKNPDAILKATYDVISGPAGERDWNRFRSLFIPEGRLTAVIEKKDGTIGYRVMTVEDYVRGGGEYFQKNPFYEREISRKTESFGHIMQIFSTYGSRKAPDAEPFERGINSFELFFDGKRWWVVSIYWDSEGPANPIPARYLEK